MTCTSEIGRIGYLGNLGYARGLVMGSLVLAPPPRQGKLEFEARSSVAGLLSGQWFANAVFSDHPTDGYSPELLGALEQAFEAVWTTLYAHVPVEGDVAKDLKIELRRTLVALAAEGVAEFQELRRRALEAMALRA